MIWLSELFLGLQEFLDAGGVVLTYIGILIFVMWVLILERMMFLSISFPRYKKKIIAKWKARTERQSWNADQIRHAMVSRARLKLNPTLSIIQALVALCPLLGLLGTVTGMIQVFDVMALTGSGSARSMASGISRATIPTMAGMVGALSGVFASGWLKRTVKREVELLEDKLTLDE